MEKISEQSATPIDALINVSLSSDKLEATIHIKPAKDDGKDPNLDDIKEALSDKEVIFGINERLLEEIAKKPIYNKAIVIAKGDKSVPGKDGTYKLLFDVDKNLKPKVNDDGSVDFHNLEMVENVKVDQVLCRITKASDGLDGMTVTGKELIAAKGKPIPNLLGKNTIYNEDETAILSTIEGQVDFEKAKINVSEVFTIYSDISNSTGNIKALGSVVINGMVQPGFTVEAKGNIEVNGNVSMASLKAGGDIILRRGMIGSNVHCEGDLTARFIENSHVFAKGEVQTAYIMNSQIKCGKSLQTMGKESKIVGGNCVVGDNVETGTLGSNAQVNTFIQIGTDSESIERQQKLLCEIPAQEKKLESLQSLIALLRQYKDADRLVGDKKTMYVDALYSYKKISVILEENKEELEKITESVKERGFGRVICKDTIYPEVTIKIGSYQSTIKEEIYAASFYYTNKGIGIGSV